MSSTRINKVGIIIGGRGTGKTTFCKNIMSGHPKKVLIFDTFDHPSYQDIPVIKPEQLGRWKKGVYRMFGSDTREMMSAIDNKLTNALVFFEDAIKYISTKLKDEEMRFVIDSKQKNLDFIFMFHGYGHVPKDLYRLCDFITVFKTNDNPIDRKNQIPHYEEVVKAYRDVMADPSKYANRTIDVSG